MRGGSGKRVLVTGGAGFLGSHLTERLLAAGDEVFCLDNYLTGSRANIAHLEGAPRFRAMEHDVTIPLALPVDEIFNLACPASPAAYQRDPIGTTKTSVLGALNLLELAARTGAKILQASTSEVYGDPAVHPQREDYWGNVNPTGPRACYDEGKRCAESLFFDMHRHHGVEVKVARIFNTFGPRLQPGDGRVVSNFIVQALSGAPLTLYGGGRQTRSFCYVSDLIEGLMRLMATGPAVTGPINLGNPHEVSIADLATTVLRLTGSPSPLVHKPLPADDPHRRCPDITLAGQLLGWRPKVPFEAGLRHTISALKVHRAADTPLMVPERAVLAHGHG